MFKKTLLTVLLASGFALSAAHAADGTINFTGKILAATCEVDTGSETQNVAMDTWGADGFGAAGSTQGNVPFSITLKGCDTGLTSANVIFTGEKDATNPSLLKLTGGADVATGVGIALYNAAGTLIDMGTPSADANVDKTAHSATMNFLAKYMSTAAKADIEPGDANATTEFTINYK